MLLFFGKITFRKHCVCLLSLLCSQTMELLSRFKGKLLQARGVDLGESAGGDEEKREGGDKKERMEGDIAW